MEIKLILTFLTGTQICYGVISDKPFDLQIMNKSKLENAKPSFKLDDKVSKGNQAGEKNLFKRRLFYANQEDKGLDYDYSEKFSTFGAKNKEIILETETEKPFDSHREKFQWDSERNRIPFNAGLDTVSLHIGEKNGEQTFVNKKLKTNVRQDWDNTDYLETEKVGLLKDDRDSRYQTNAFSGNIEVVNNNENRKGSTSHFNTDYGTTENEMVSAFRPRYEVPASSVFSLPKVQPVQDFPVENPDFYTPDKAIIINLKTECPLPNLTKRRIIHKYIISPKSHINSHHSHLIPGAHFLHPTSDALYYI